MADRKRKAGYLSGGVTFVFAKQPRIEDLVFLSRLTVDGERQLKVVWAARRSTLEVRQGKLPRPIVCRPFLLRSLSFRLRQDYGA